MKVLPNEKKKFQPSGKKKISTFQCTKKILHLLKSACLKQVNKVLLRDLHPNKQLITM